VNVWSDFTLLTGLLHADKIDLSQTSDVGTNIMISDAEPVCCQGTTSGAESISMLA
jgi:hypothetical protein